MAVEALIYHYQLHFKEPAMTSRGTYLNHDVWYLVLQDLERGYWAVGECAPLPDLSPEYMQYRHSALSGAELSEERVAESYGLLVAQEFAHFLHNWRQLSGDARNLDTQVPIQDLLCDVDPWLSAIRFALETVYQQWSQCVALDQQHHSSERSTSSWELWPNAFSAGSEGITINGLIWMGNFEQMSARITAKLEQGYHCVKLKIGAIDFERELDLLSQIRERFTKEQLELRVDANGAFKPHEAMRKLELLSAFDLHSIEQPIKAGQWSALRELCESSPLPIALDEELIGVKRREDRQRLLDAIYPQYIVLKPTLHGGLCGTLEWIEEAQQRDIGYWLTSALESNVGLNALSQWLAQYEHPLPQGLGTGQLYTNNLPIPLSLKGDQLWLNAMSPSQACDLSNQVRAHLEQQAVLVSRVVLN